MLQFGKFLRIPSETFVPSTLDKRDFILIIFYSTDESATDLPKTLEIRRTGHIPKSNVFVIYLRESVRIGTQLEINIEFSGRIDVQPEGLFLGTYSSDNGTKQ